MKYYTIICFLIICPFSLVAQEYDLSGTHGLKGKKGVFCFELSGYEIYTSVEKGNITNEKTIKSIKNKYKIKEVIAEYTDEELEIPHTIIESHLTLKDQPDIQGTQLCYLFEQPNNTVSVICFNTMHSREQSLEQAIIKAYLTDDLMQYVNDDVSSVFFAGRWVKLGNRCEWMSPHNLRCGGGQINWSEFPSYEKAMQDNDLRVISNANKKNSIILMEEEIEVLFENIPTIAYRVVYTQNSRYPLVVYYIVEEVRGRYISCVLSNYGYNRYDYELADFLEEFMTIPELPEDAYNKYDKPEFEEAIHAPKLDNPMSFWEIRTGTWLPMGALKNKFQVAPSIGVALGGPIVENMALDLFVQIAFPVNQQPFEYYYAKDDYEFTKTDLMINMGLRLRRQTTLANNLYLSSYLGFGVNMLSTDLEKEEYSEDEDKYQSVPTLDLSGGLNLRYKSIGCFLEYHYSPYAIRNKVRNNFGTNAIHIGINLSF